MKRFLSAAFVYLVCSSIACFVYLRYWQPSEIKSLKHDNQLQSEAIQGLQRKNVELRQQLASRKVEDQLAAQAEKIQEQDAKWCALEPGQLDEEASRLEWLNKEINRFKDRVSKLNTELQNGQGK